MVSILYIVLIFVFMISCFKYRKKFLHKWNIFFSCVYIYGCLSSFELEYASSSSASFLRLFSRGYDIEIAWIHGWSWLLKTVYLKELVHAQIHTTQHIFVKHEFKYRTRLISKGRYSQNSVNAMMTFNNPLLQNNKAKFNKTRHRVLWVEGNSSKFKTCTTAFSKTI